MEATFTAYLEEVRAHRGDMLESVRALEETLAAPIALGRDWLERVAAALAELAHDFGDHVELTERPGGLYAVARASAPRLDAAGQRLVREHVDLRARLAAALGEIDSADERGLDLGALREDLTGLIGALVRHRQRGSDLVYEAFEVDLGGSD